MIKNLLRAFTYLLVVICLSEPASSQSAASFAADHPLKSMSRYLHNRVRPDVGGEGLWMPQVDKDLKGWLKPQPGFVGDVYYVHATNLKGLFGLKFFDGANLELKPEVASQDWYPTHTVTRYRAGGFEITETKLITDSEVVRSDLSVRNAGRQPSTLRVEVIDLLKGEPVNSGRIKRLVFSPTTHYFRDLKIQKYYRLRGRGISLHDDSTEEAKTFRLAPGQSDWFIITLAFANAIEDLDRISLESSSLIANGKESVARMLHVKKFDDWFRQNVPPLRTSDPALEKMYYYRWYLLKKSRVDTRKLVPNHPYPYPALYEGLIGTWFPKIIGFPLPMQILEARWLNDKRIAYDQARNALTREDFFNYLNWTPYAFWQLHLVAPDREFLKRALPAAENFIKLEEVKDEDRDFLPSVFGSWITGMEYQPSFFYFTKERWDHTTSEEFRPELDALSRDPGVYRQFTAIERVDEASYYFLNHVGVAKIARALGEESTARKYESRAAAIKNAVDQKMWDGQTGFFYDLNPASDEKALGAKSIVGFWPYLFGEMQGTERLALFDHLLDPGEFWTKYPVASASKDCPAFDSQGNWIAGPKASPEKPDFYVCSWNGPTWIFSEALAAESLGQAVRISRSPRLKTAFNDLMRVYTRLQFVNQDLSLPCTVEHYNSETGRPVRFLADYFHSFYNDLVIRYFAGVVPREDGMIEVDPLIEGVDDFEIRNVVYQNHSLSVRISKRRGYSVSLDGKLVFSSARPQRVVIDPLGKSQTRKPADQR